MTTVLNEVFGAGSVRFAPVDRGCNQAQSAANAVAASAEVSGHFDFMFLTRYDCRVKQDIGGS
eukprot:891049-Alexandrium_andersonii.AAC.1